MRTTFDQNYILYALLVSSPIKTAITGNIYKNVRPDDSALEDVVINSLPISTGDIQISTGNVNIHVPDIKVGNTFMPNEDRMRVLSEIVKPILEKGHSTFYRFYLSHQSTIFQEGVNQSFVNFRIEFQYFF